MIKNVICKGSYGYHRINQSIKSILVRQLHTLKFRMQKQQHVYQQKLHHVHTVQNI